jgi:hypothetical protein
LAAAAAAAPEVAPAVAAAAAEPHGLVLQAFSASSIDGPILAQLPSQHITSLSLSHDGALHGTAAVNTALLRLTGLKTLALYHASRPHHGDDFFLFPGVPMWAMRPSWDAQDDVCWSADGLLPGLTALHQLTR